MPVSQRQAVKTISPVPPRTPASDRPHRCAHSISRIAAGVLAPVVLIGALAAVSVSARRHSPPPRSSSATATIDHEWRDVRDMTEWVRAYLGCGPFFGAWAIDEQRVAGRPRACHSDDGPSSTTACWGAVNALYAERTGDDDARKRAFNSLNYATYFTDAEGRVACCGDDFENPYWFDDGFSDYTPQLQTG